MDPASSLPLLLGLAWLVPLASFVVILFFGPRLGHHGRNAAWVATAAIVTSFVLSLAAFVTWLGAHPVAAPAHGHGAAHAGTDHDAAAGHGPVAADADHAPHDHGADDHGGGHHAAVVPPAYAGDWYTLYEGGSCGSRSAGTSIP